MKTINGNLNLVKELLSQQILVNRQNVDKCLKDVGAPELSIHEIVLMYANLCKEFDGDIVSKCVDKDKYVLLHNGDLVNSVSELIPDKEIQKLMGRIISDPHFVLMDLENAKHELFVKEMIEKNKEEYPFITNRSFYAFRKDEDFAKAADKIREFIVENKNNDFINYKEYVEYAKMAFEETCAFRATMFDDIFSDFIGTVYIICNGESQYHQCVDIETLADILSKDAKSVNKTAKKDEEDTKKVPSIPNIDDMDVPEVPKETYICYDLLGQKINLKIVDIQGYNVIVQKEGENNCTTLTNVIYECIKQASTKDLLDFYNLVNFRDTEKNKVKGIKDVSISKTGAVYVTFDNNVVAEVSITIIKGSNEPLISVRIV